MKKVWLILLVTFTASFAFADPPKPVVVDGTCVEMTPPAGFSKSDKFPGFENRDLKASLIVTIIEGSYAEVVPIYSKDGLDQHNVEFQKSEDALFGTNHGIIVTGLQMKDGKKFICWFGVFGNDFVTAVVSSNIPTDVPQNAQDALLASVRSARMNESLIKDPCAGLPFFVREIEPFKISNKTKDAVVLTPGGKAKVDITTEATIVVGMVPRKTDDTDVIDYAKSRVINASYATGVTIKQTKSITIGTLPSVVVVAMASHKGDGTPIVIFLTVIADKQIFYVFQGITSQTETGQKYFTGFQQILGTFRLRMK